MDERYRQANQDLFEDEDWVLLGDKERPGEYLIFHLKHHMAHLIDNEEANRALCAELISLGRPVLTDLPNDIRPATVEAEDKNRPTDQSKGS